MGSLYKEGLINMSITENKVLFFALVSIFTMYCLIFLYKFIKGIINCIRYIKCKNKYKNIIPNYMRQCENVEQLLQKRGVENGVK